MRMNMNKNLAKNRLKLKENLNQKTTEFKFIPKNHAKCFLGMPNNHLNFDTDQNAAQSQDKINRIARGCLPVPCQVTCCLFPCQWLK